MAFFRGEGKDFEFAGFGERQHGGDAGDDKADLATDHGRCRRTRAFEGHMQQFYAADVFEQRAAEVVG